MQRQTKRSRGTSDEHSSKSANLREEHKQVAWLGGHGSRAHHSLHSIPVTWLFALLVTAMISPVGAQTGVPEGEQTSSPSDAMTTVPSTTPSDAALEWTGVDLASVGSGELLWRTDRGLISLPMLQSEVELNITGIMQHGKLTQRFHNPSSHVIEALYVFPLPENAAVHHMEIRVGNRRIVSIIQERKQAKRTYEKAREKGQKAALVEQERPNLFTTSVANINPGEVVSVVLEYIEEVVFADGVFRVTFPLTFTPRYIPEGMLQIEESTGATSIVSASVSDADRITPPFVESYSASAPTAHFRARIRAGLPLRRVGSPSHDVRVRSNGEVVVLEPAAAQMPADRDLILEWEPAIGEAAEFALHVEQQEPDSYALLMLLPPSPESVGTSGFATETLFVIDVSGSMAGPSIDQAREALEGALNRLRPSDRFNIIKFNDRHQLYSQGFEDADTSNLAAARGWVRGLQADGGTEIYSALLRAISMFEPKDPSIIQRILFLTDGAIGNESQMLQRVADGLGRVRLHCIGIGHAPNRYLMRKMAMLGGGICEFIATTSEADNRIDRFFAKLDRPVMTDLRLEWQGLEAFEVQPAVLPDLHAGEPLYLSARLLRGATQGRVLLHGRTHHGMVQHAFSVEASSAETEGAVAKRWARARVASLMDSLHEGAHPDSVRAAVIEVAQDHHLVTRYTSLVAVEEEITAQGESRPLRVANALPHGSQLLRTGLPQGATSAPARRAAALLLIVSGTLLLAVPRIPWRNREH